MTSLSFTPGEEFPIQGENVEIEMQFKLTSCSAKGYIGKGSAAIMIEDLDNGLEYRLTQKNIQPVINLYNEAIVNRTGFLVARFRS